MTWFSRIGLYLSFIFWILVHSACIGQNAAGEDSTLKMTSKKNIHDTIVKKHNPTKASIYSMVLPGLGQAYNKKYWKIPIVYAGFGVFYYFIQFNNKEYKAWRAAYNHTLLDPDDLEPPVNDYELYYGDRENVLKDQKDYYRRNRDLTYILTSVWYLLNIVDATVDAHLFTWEVDENLSMKIGPSLIEPLMGYKPNGGVRLTLRF